MRQRWIVGYQQDCYLGRRGCRISVGLVFGAVVDCHINRSSIGTLVDCII